jgi:hypothetical protein
VVGSVNMAACGALERDRNMSATGRAGAAAASRFRVASASCSHNGRRHTGKSLPPAVRQQRRQLAQQLANLLDTAQNATLESGGTHFENALNTMNSYMGSLCVFSQRESR